MRLYRFNAALALPIAVAAFGSLGVGSTDADAKVVQIPPTQPKVLLDVPDDWTVLPVDSSFELRSPDKTSIVIVGIVKRDKSEVIAWHAMATSKMVAFGVKFDPKAVAPPPVPKAAEATPATPAKPDLASLGIGPGAPAQSAPPAAASSTGDANAPAAASADAAVPAPTTVFSGAPSIALPGKPPAVATAEDREPEPAFALEQFNATTLPKIGPRMTSKAAFLYGATLDGKPVDAQFFNFGLSKDAAFLLQQESTPTDNRAVDIVNSVRRAL